MEHPAAKSGKRTVWFDRLKNIGGFRHKVDAAKDHVGVLRPFRRQLGQQQGVPPEVGVYDDFIPLIVMPQNQHLIAECLLGGPGPVKEFLDRDRLVIGYGESAGFNGIHARTSSSGDSNLLNGLLPSLDGQASTQSKLVIVADIEHPATVPGGTYTEC